MSYWYEPKLKDVGLSDDRKDVHILLGNDESGNIWASIPVSHLAQFFQGIEFLCGVFDKPESIAEGGCGNAVNVLEGYRCGDCTAYFHRDCLRKHFNQESVEEIRKALKMDEWQPLVTELAKEGKEQHLIGVVFALLDEQRKSLK